MGSAGDFRSRYDGNQEQNAPDNLYHKCLHGWRMAKYRVRFLQTIYTSTYPAYVPVTILLFIGC
jgi:hypothetical protein